MTESSGEAHRNYPISFDELEATAMDMTTFMLSRKKKAAVLASCPQQNPTVLDCHRISPRVQ